MNTPKLTAAIEAVLEAAEKATPRPWEAYDNYIMSEHCDGERGEMVAECFAGNPMHGDNSNDTHYITESANNAKHFALALKEIMAVARTEIGHCDCGADDGGSDHSHRQVTCALHEAIARAERLFNE